MPAASSITVRLNPLLIVVFLLPVLFFVQPAYDSYQRFSSGAVGSDEKHYYVSTPLGRRTYEREIIDETLEYKKGSFAEKWDALIRESYNRDVELAKQYINSQRQLFYLFFTCGAFLLFVAFLFWFTTKIELSEDTITVRSPLLRKKDTVAVGKIRALRITTAIPLTPKRTNISQINWRDKIEIDDRSEIPMVVSLLAFPTFSKIVEEVLKQRPKIKVNFHRWSVSKSKI